MVVAERMQLQRLSVAHRACALSLVPCLTSAARLPMPALGDGCGIMVLKRELVDRWHDEWRDACCATGETLVIAGRLPVLAKVR